MADRDSLETRLSGFVGDTRGDVVPPAYDALVTTSHRRRRGRVAMVCVATLVVIGTGLAGAQGVLGHDARPTPPSDTPHASRHTDLSTPTGNGDSTAPSPGAPLTAEQIVDAQNSYLVAFGVSAEDRNAQASVWRCQEQPTCQGWRGGVAVTSDGFATRTVVDLPRHANLNVLDVGNKTFLVGDAPHGVLVRADGTTTAMTVDSTPAPLASGEVVVGLWKGTSARTSGALNPANGQVHPLDLPANDSVDLHTTPDGLIYGVAFTNTSTGTSQRVIWSNDNAVSWHEQAIPDLPANTHLLPLASQRDGTFPYLVTGDGATLASMSGFYGSSDGGQTWQSFDAPSDPTGYVTTGWVQPDGSMLVNVISWSDARTNRPSGRPLGFYESAGGDWGDLQPVGQLPGQVDPAYVVSPFDLISATPDGTRSRVWITGNGNVFESGPGFDRWQQVTVR